MVSFQLEWRNIPFYISMFLYEESNGKSNVFCVGRLVNGEEESSYKNTEKFVLWKDPPLDMNEYITQR